MKLVSVLFLSFILLSAVSGVTAGEATFCISGNSTGAGWSVGVATWNPPAGGYVYQIAQCPGVPAGSGCEVLAQAFVDCINSIEGGDPSATVDPEDPCCFTITSSWTQVDLFVGPAGGDADCEVTETGCEFNPFIVRIGGIGPIPTLGEWGMIIFGVLLAGWMGWMFMRRRSKVTAGF